MKGECEAIGGEFVLPEKDGILKTEDVEVWNALEKIYLDRGFEVRRYGPYVDGGPSSVYHGIDLMVSWGPKK